MILNIILIYQKAPSIPRSTSRAPHVAAEWGDRKWRRERVGAERSSTDKSLKICRLVNAKQFRQTLNMRLIATSLSGGAPPSPLFLSATCDHPILLLREELVVNF
ncbi:hypothetical protein J6590_082931 [Homalodisca vitripennis]|nr:hypothetical protein J6590_082931 [Homalodisca vitripennis]